MLLFENSKSKYLWGVVGINRHSRLDHEGTPVGNFVDEVNRTAMFPIARFQHRLMGV